MDMKISVSSAHSIAAEEEHYRKVCAWWIPKFWTPEMKDWLRDVCSVLLARYKREGYASLECMITGDESYVHFFTLECKRASPEWQHQS